MVLVQNQMCVLTGSIVDFSYTKQGDYMKVKSGVKLAGLKLEMRKVLVEADKLWKAHNQELVVTSTLDGVHSAGSLHPYGYAVDLRTRYFDTAEYNVLAGELRLMLGDKYDVIVHYSHIHVEYDAILK